MFLEGDKEVFKRLFEKRRLLEAHDARHQDIRPLLLIPLERCGECTEEDRPWRSSVSVYPRRLM
jgi:hypothetical protein